MTRVAERLFEWLSSQPDVTLVADASTRGFGDGIRFHADGQDWFLALDHADVRTGVWDPRDRDVENGGDD